MWHYTSGFRVYIPDETPAQNPYTVERHGQIITPPNANDPTRGEDLSYKVRASILHSRPDAAVDVVHDLLQHTHNSPLARRSIGET